jgi:antiviral helicase SLH1
MSEADTLALLSMSTEFHQLQVRENEVPELQALMKDVIPCQVKGGTDTTPGKVNILLQAYICRAHIEDFALVSDTAYVAQNAGRIIRALLEIALSRKWGNAAFVLASMSKSIEKQLWSYQNPLKQSKLQYMVMHNLETYADDYTPGELAEMTPAQVGDLIKMNDKHGAAIVAVAKQFPTVGVTYELRPLSHDLLQIHVHLSRNFQWSQTLHGFSEPFWVWIEDSSSNAIFQYQSIQFKPSTTLVHMEFVVPIRTSMPQAYAIRVLSDHWVGSEEEIEISLVDLAMPAEPETPTALLSVPYLSLSNVLKPLNFGTGYSDRFSSYNNIQSQVFWPLFYTDESLLLAAPNGSGKSTIGDVATW